MTRLQLNFTVCASVFILTSCVSSLFKEAPPTFSDQIILTAPADNFQPQKSAIYPTWKNKTTSNVISVVSECLDQNTGLKAMHSVITNSVDQEVVVEEKKVTFKNTNGYFRKITGQIDGHDIEVHSISFKYKNCTYLTSLSGGSDKLNSDLIDWNNFNQKIEFKK